MLALATLLSVLDSVAKGVEIFNTAMGAGVEANTVSKGAEDNASTLAAVDDQDVQRQLTPVFARRADLVTKAALATALQGSFLHRALDKHYGSSGGLNKFLTDQNARVHVHLRSIGLQLDARNVMPPVVDPMASYNGTGALLGNFVDNLAIDTQLYGEAPLEVVVDAQGAAARTVRLTVKKFDGTSVDRDVVIPGGTVAGTAIAVGAGADRFVDVTNIITTAGGQAGDNSHVRSKVERVIAL